MQFTTPENFSFKNTIYSHGWYDLPPFETDPEIRQLTCVFNDASFNRPVSARIGVSETGLVNGDRLTVEFTGGQPGQAEKRTIRAQIRHILRIDEDFTEFYELTRLNKDFVWIEQNKLGRLLRSPTVYEDLVKTVCTTNCSWALTKKMVANLVEKLGAEAGDGKKAFPTPEAMAEQDERFYREEIRAGYRSGYFVEMAEAVASGRVDPEQWLATELPTRELKKEMKKVKGVGDYAAENLLKLVGRYDGLALDSFLRSEFYKKHKRQQVCTDAEIGEFYSGFGEWRGLAIWFDMTKRWFD